MIDGEIILYLVLIFSALTVTGLLLKEAKGYEHLMNYIPWLSRISFALLMFDILLLAYYFITSDFTIMYVWQYSSLSLPLSYRISAVLAGQSGTLLFWSFVIYFASIWIAETHRWHNSIVRKTQIVTILCGMFFVVLTIMESPFSTIYAVNPELPATFVPADGNGLNPLLINPWMVAHPPLVFIAYGFATIPFAAAIVNLLTGDARWESIARPWSRITWVFLTLAIAVGGLWAYLVLGWGGFWAWDPVETSSLIPWITLTAYLHASSGYRKNKGTFTTGAPLLAIVSMLMIVYAALVTRSGIFESVHAFGDSSSGTMLIVFMIISLLAGGIPVVKRFFFEEDYPGENIDSSSVKGICSTSTLYYLTTVLFVILAFTSFWGITFPALIQQIEGVKVGVGTEFFNIWGYPAIISLLILTGYCLHREDNITSRKMALIVTVSATILFAFIDIDPAFHVMDHTNPFWTAQPPLYKLIGSVSLLSLFPPILYVLAVTIQRIVSDLRSATLSSRALARRTGVNIIHMGMVLILFGAVMSASFTSTIGASVPTGQIGDYVELEGGYGLKITDYRIEGGPGDRITDVKQNPSAYPVAGITGTVSDIQRAGIFLIFKLNDGSDSIWIASKDVEISPGEEVSVSGSIMHDFESSSTGQIYDYILFTENVVPAKSEDETSWKVYIEVYKNGKVMGNGMAEYIQYKQGDATHPMVDRSLTKDVYAIFQGSKSGNIPLTIMIKPFVNEVWIGVIMFTLGMILILGSELYFKREVHSDKLLNTISKEYQKEGK